MEAVGEHLLHSPHESSAMYPTTEWDVSWVRNDTVVWHHAPTKCHVMAPTLHPNTPTCGDWTKPMAQPTRQQTNGVTGIR